MFGALGLGLTWSDPVQHGERVVRGQCRHVQIVDGGLLRRQRRQLVEVGGEQAEAADLGGDVLANGPGQAEAVVRGRASTKLVDDDERLLRGRAGGTTQRLMKRRPVRRHQPWLCLHACGLTAGWQPSPASRT